MEDFNLRMPAEWEPHAATIMAWPTSMSILDEAWEYPGADVNATYLELTNIIKAISQFESVHIFIRDPKSIDSSETSSSKESPSTASGHPSAMKLLKPLPNTTLHLTPNTDSLWARDTGPVFVTSASPLTNTYHPTDAPGPGFTPTSVTSTKVSLLLSFNQWGKSFSPSPDCYLAPTISQTFGLPSLLAPFISEGGSIEVDGRGTLLITESSILNCNRNPGISKSRMESYLKEFLGVRKVVWLKGKRGADVTDGHVDCLARFCEVRGRVLVSREKGESGELVWREAVEVLQKSTDAEGKRFEVVTVEEPDPEVVLGRDYVAEAGPCVSYVNFQIVNGGVVMAKFGDEERDREAKRVVEESFPSRRVVQVQLRQLALQGGGIHCATKQLIK